MNIPVFYRPSTPNEGIIFRTPNIADAMRFNKIDPDEEEAMSTLYLNALQEPKGQSDAAKWTAQDRRTALWWIYTGSTSSPVETFFYDCKHCGETHPYDCDMNDLAQDIEILHHSPFIDGVKIPANGLECEWRIKPLDGASMEALELRRASLPDPDDDHYADALIELRLWEFVFQCELFYDVIGTPDEILQRRFETVQSMALDTEFMYLAASIKDMQDSLNHGLPCRIDKGECHIHLPAHQCPVMTKKETTGSFETRLWVRFRPVLFIPQLGLERLSELSIQPGFVWGYASGRHKGDD